MFALATVLGLLDKVGPVIAAIPQFKEVFDGVVGTFKEKDQAVLKQTYAALIAENDAGHVRLQDKLRDAETR